MRIAQAVRAHCTVCELLTSSFILFHATMWTIFMIVDVSADSLFFFSANNCSVFNVSKMLWNTYTLVTLEMKWNYYERIIQHWDRRASSEFDNKNSQLRREVRPIIQPICCKRTMIDFFGLNNFQLMHANRLYLFEKRIKYVWQTILLIRSTVFLMNDCKSKENHTNRSQIRFKQSLRLLWKIPANCPIVSKTRNEWVWCKLDGYEGTVSLDGNFNVMTHWFDMDHHFSAFKSKKIVCSVPH